jgi:secondary thiamine-phosphate synthase enzyme
MRIASQQGGAEPIASPKTTWVRQLVPQSLRETRLSLPRGSAASAHAKDVGVKVHQRAVVIPTKGRGLYDVTAAVAAVAAEAAVDIGLCTVFLRHTSASLVIQENADPSVLRDLERWMDRLAPEDRSYEHDAEGPDDMPGHLRSAVTSSSVSIPITAGSLALGTWQALYLWEHRRAPHRRELVVHVAGT